MAAFRDRTFCRAVSPGLGPATMIPMYAGISADVAGGDIPIAEHSVSAAQAPRTREATDMTCPFHRSGRSSAWSSICAATLTYVTIKMGGAYRENNGRKFLSTKP